MSLFLRAALAFLFIAAAPLIGYARLRPPDDPYKPSPLDSVMSDVLAGKYSGFYRLSPKWRFRVIRRLKDKILPQHEPDDPDALAVGRTLVALHAEQTLKRLIIALDKDFPGADRERSIAFDALSFMKSRASVRVTASFLSNREALKLQEQMSSLSRMTDQERHSFFRDHPLVLTILRGCVHSDVIGEAQYALGRMKFPGAPVWDPSIGFKEGDDDRWREWWKSNRSKFEGEGPLPVE